MLVILYLLPMITVGRCTDDLTFATETVDVGGDVNLTCPRPETLDEYKSTLYWIRLVSGNWPEFLGGTYGFKFDDGVNKTPHIRAKQEPGAFVLHISQTRLSDTGVYYCIKVKSLHMTFLNGTFLRIKGPEPDITAVIQVSPSDPVHSGDSVSLQCSVLSDSEDKTCPEDHRVYWFRAKSDESHPSLIYAHQNNTDRCERSPETHSQKCVYSFSKNISSSDAGTYYCAVASCGEIIFGNGTKLNIKALEMWDLEKANIIVFLLCAVLTTSLIVIAFLIYTIKKSRHGN
ncbi:signal-regulatory protein beta-2-like, partial [Mugil cephalus]|uniref:signal-regulatory protein beta-2-like n=1 Tax=Mugil cephalus TaxID=48193 RepID=UPI001FB6CA44